LDRFTEHLVDTRDRVHELKQQQATYTQAEADRAAYLRKLAPARGLIPPSALANAPQVPTGWRGDLNAQAQQLMQTPTPSSPAPTPASSVPSPFDPRGRYDAWNHSTQGAGSPAVEASPGASASRAASSRSAAGLQPAAGDLIGRAPATSGDTRTSPILDGGLPHPPATLPTLATDRAGPARVQSRPGIDEPYRTWRLPHSASCLGAVAAPTQRGSHRTVRAARTAAAGVGELPRTHGTGRPSGAGGRDGRAPMAPDRSRFLDRSADQPPSAESSARSRDATARPE
jgi:hypothetical protein